MSFHSQMPDIAGRRPAKNSLPIDLVGIQGLEIPIHLKGLKGPVPASVDAAVSLEDPQVRGVHMSRMSKTLHDRFRISPLSFKLLSASLKEIISRQGKPSLRGRIHVSAKQPVLRKALKSALKGWRYYPFFYQAVWDGKKFNYVLGGSVVYSSTCPCSAALCREAVARSFEEDFPSLRPAAGERPHVDRSEVLQWLKGERSQTATPHAQKSEAFFQVSLNERQKDQIPILGIINDIEGALQTSVQTAVKREDELEFAKLNGSNMMFCEDAVRRVGALFQKKPFKDYYIRVRHFESLHPFTVESVLTKGGAAVFSAPFSTAQGF